MAAVAANTEPVPKVASPKRITGTRPLNHPQRRLAALAVLAREWLRLQRASGKSSVAAANRVLRARFMGARFLRRFVWLRVEGTAAHAEIRWPDGVIEVIANLAVDKFYTVREGAGVVSQGT